MHPIFYTFVLFITIWLMPLQAITTHSVGLSDCDERFFVVQPENSVSIDNDYLDLLFKAPEERLAAFHFFYDDQYDLKNPDDVWDYTDWICGRLFNDPQYTNDRLNTSQEYATRSFTVREASGQKTFCFIYVGKLQNEVNFSVITTNPQSLEATIRDNTTFIQQITWGKK